jgi:hypothetical protein
LQGASNSLELLLSLLLECQLDARIAVRGAAMLKRKPCNRDIWPAIQVPSQPPILCRFVSLCR